MGPVPPLAMLKLSLSVAAIVLFGIGVYTGAEIYRWVAIGLLAVAVILRFVGRKPQ